MADNPSVTAAAGWAAAARCLALDAFTAHTSELLTAAGIDNILLKGPVTARRLYPDRPDLRTYTDVDLLVRVDRFNAAQDVLRLGGYRWLLAGVRDGEFPWHETAWKAPGSADLALDLHRGFAGVPDPSAFFDDLWASRERLELSGVAVDIPSISGTALILALHAAAPGRGRKPLADIIRAQEVFPIDVWRGGAALAHRCDADPACRAGLGLLPGGLELADEIGIGGEVTADRWLGGRQFDRVSVNLAAALGQPGIRASIVYAVRHLLPSPAFLRLHDVSARRGPGWLLLGYLRRLTRAVVGAPRAAANVVKARRALRRDQRRVST